MADVEVPTSTDLGDTNTPAPDQGQQSGKKPRKRLKKICSQIRDQMEFYFSDANLHKDRFIKQLIDQREDRYVQVSVFANFNKLHQLTTDMKLVVKALSTSTTLEVSEDKEYIRRKTPYKVPLDVDDRTIYVESLPREADHEWLKQTFSSYGKVVYVSLPRYRTTGDVKGFAFIEFETKEAVEKACQSFQPVDPDEDKAPRFPKFNKQLQSLQKQIGATGEKVEERRPRRRQTTSESESGDSVPSKRQKLSSESSDNESSTCKRVGDKGRQSKDGEGQEPTKGRSRKRSDGEGSDRETKKPKTSTGEEPKDSETADTKEKDKKETNSSKKRKRSEDSDVKKEVPEVTEKREKKEDEGEKKDEKTGDKSKDTGEGVLQGVMVDPQKRKRHSETQDSDGGEGKEVKRVRISELVDVKENVEVAHKKKRTKKKKRKEDKEKTEEVKPQLKVLPKHTWLGLKKEYLNLQRSSMKALKKSLQKIKKEETKVQAPDAVPLDSYVAEGAQAAPTTTTLQFTPGVIIKVDTEQPCTRKDLKETLSLVADLPYVDFQDGDQQGYARCATPEDALRVIASKPSSFKVSLLQGEEESTYWGKINADREQKRSSKTRSKKRGTQKLMERAEKTILSGAPKKHIVFDD